MLPAVNTQPSSSASFSQQVENESTWHQLTTAWQNWAEQAVPGKGECRDIAVRRLKKCLERQAIYLDLSDLRLTTLPDLLPVFLLELNVNDNCLTHLPKKLPALLEILNVSDNHLTELPKRLPIALKSLDASDNKLTHLSVSSNWPLEELDVSSNHITCLPEKLPKRLKKLYVSYNNLTSLPAKLPPCLTTLFADGNRLSNLPETLPDSLKVLNVDHNCLDCLPEYLPINLEIMDVNYNNLSRLPARLPYLLKKLYVSYNKLTYLPLLLPTELNSLDIRYNQLRYLPANLPNLLRRLDVSHNRLVSLPNRLPHCLDLLNLNNNQLTCLPDVLPHLSELYVCDNQLMYLPETLPDTLTVLNIGHNLLQDLPENIPSSLRTVDVSALFAKHWYRTLSGFFTSVQHWDSQADKETWQAIYTEPHANVFGEFLYKLRQGKNYHSRQLRSRVASCLTYLSAQGRSALRKDIFLLANEAIGSCVDRASFYFNSMYILMVEDELLETQAPLTEVVKMILSNFRLQILQRIATKHAADRRVQSPDFVEDLEIHLAYQCKLQAELSLPIDTQLQFEDIANLTEEDLNQAKERVIEEQNRDFMRYWLTESTLWTTILKKWNAEKMAAAEDSYREFSYSDDFTVAQQQVLTDRGIPLDDADALRIVSQQLACQWLYKQRYQLTREFLTEKQALFLLDSFNAER